MLVHVHCFVKLLVNIVFSRVRTFKLIYVECEKLLVIFITSCANLSQREPLLKYTLMSMIILSNLNFFFSFPTYVCA